MNMTSLNINLGENSYVVTVGRGLLARADEFFNLSRKVLVVTDSGVPKEYAKAVAARAREAKIITLPEGEGTKSFLRLQEVLSAMVDFGMTRGDCAVAVGGGVIGDLVGFAASIYMRGIDFYGVPTTVLSMVDSSVGGKCAVNFVGVKNIIGSFHQPKGVLADIDCLKTLPTRQVTNGLAEALKMSLTSNAELFSIFEGGEVSEDIETIIIESIKIKRAVVEADERECGLRRILNFGHTLGHGIEAEEEMHGLFHGECVALGMLPMLSPALRERVLAVYKKLRLPTEYSGDIDTALSYVAHDKKCAGGAVNVIFVDEIGKHREEKIEISEFGEVVRSYYNK